VGRDLPDILLEIKDLVVDYNPSTHLLRQVMSRPKELAKSQPTAAGG
jgi:hypothetical protein